MSKHTPGPWELRGWSVKCPTNNFRVARIGEPDKALRQFGDYEDMEAECRANARLIAAAPDLLAALKDALRSARHDFDAGEKGEAEFRAAYSEQFAAIAKAEGLCS